MTPQFIMRAGLKPDAYVSVEDVRCASGYAEPGYGNPETHCILLANWNDFDDRVTGLLEQKGFDIEWSDEWLICDCGKAFRTSGDCWDWKMYGWIGDGDYCCGDCIQDDPEEYLAERIDNPNNAVNTDLVDLLAAGFLKRSPERYQNGLHPGQTDDPVKVLSQFQEERPQEEFVFTFYPSQFYVEFDIWGRDKTA